LLAEIVPGRDLGLMITAAVLIALLLLLGKLRNAIDDAALAQPRYGLREAALLFGIGAWTGFIVLDGATYLLIMLVLMVGLPLTNANAIKTFVAIPTAIVPMAIFLYKGSIDWRVGAVAGVGSVLGGYVGARFASSPGAKRQALCLLSAGDRVVGRAGEPRAALHLQDARLSASATCARDHSRISSSPSLRQASARGRE
jgi:uncharacterized membrane protein YfcA